MRYIRTVANQKIIKVRKEPCSDKNRDQYYAKINLAALQSAAQDMHGKQASGFMLWVYLAKNINGFEMALSNKAVTRAFGMSRDAYDTAVQLLIKKGYLVQTGKKHYDFYERPKTTSYPSEPT